MLKKLFKKYLLLLFLSYSAFAQTQTLEFYINEGLHNSPLLKDFNNQLIGQRYDSLLARAAFMTQVNLTSQAMYAPVGKNFGYDSAITNGGNYAALINITQPLFFRKTRQVQLQNILLSSQAIQINTKITETDLKKSISTQYITAYAAYTEVQFSERLLDLLNKEEITVRQLVQKGIYLQTDLMNLSISIKAAEIDKKKNILQYKNDVAVLNLICGITDTSAVQLTDPNLTVNNTFDINNSPLMMQLSIDSLHITTSKQLITLEYRPKLNAFADAGFNAINPGDIQNHFGTSIGLNFVMPIYDGRQRKLKYSRIDLAENTRLNNKTFYIAQYRQQFYQLKEQLQLSDDLLNSIENQVSEQEKLLELYKIEIDQGLVRFLDFITMANSYAATANNLTVAKMNRLQLINQMNYLK